MSITEAAAIRAVHDGLEGRNVPIVHEEIRVVLAMALERDVLRARVETAECDLESARGLIARLGDADALESLNALLTHERARVAELERECADLSRTLEYRDDSRKHLKERAERAEADAARLREACADIDLVGVAAYGELQNFARDLDAISSADNRHVRRIANQLRERLGRIDTALASVPSAEPEGPDYSGLCSAPECGGHCGYTHAVGCEAIREYLAEHGGDAYKAPARTAHLAPSAPTPRDMRVAEAVREACVESCDDQRYDASRYDCGRALLALDLAAVVAKAVGT